MRNTIGAPEGVVLAQAASAVDVDRVNLEHLHACARFCECGGGLLHVSGGSLERTVAAAAAKWRRQQQPICGLIYAQFTEVYCWRMLSVHTQHTRCARCYGAPAMACALQPFAAVCCSSAAGVASHKIVCG